MRIGRVGASAIVTAVILCVVAFGATTDTRASVLRYPGSSHQSRAAATPPTGAGRDGSPLRPWRFHALRTPTATRTRTALLSLLPASQTQRSARVVSGELRAPLIHGGEESDVSRWPWAAFIVSFFGADADADGVPDEAAACSGSLIGQQWVMSAAHCISETEGPNAGQLLPGLEVVAVVLGVSDLEGLSESDVFLADALYTGAFDPAAGVGDIALLRLGGEVASPTVAQAIRLPRPNELRRWSPGTAASVIGWGETEMGFTSRLHEARTRINDDSDCAGPYEQVIGARYIPGAMLCTGSFEPKRLRPGTSYGDSGGPLMVSDGRGSWLQAGLAGFGIYQRDSEIADYYTELLGFIDPLVATVVSDPIAPVARPVAETGGVVRIARQRAAIRGTVEANGLATQYRLQYGRTRSYGMGSAGDAGTSHEAREVKAILTGLRPGTRYHYRLVAVNAAGTTTGRDRVLKTKRDRTPPTVRALPGRGTAGETVALRYRVWDDTSAKTRERVTVKLLSGAKVARLARKTHTSRRGVVYSARWRAPVGFRGRVHFCVTSWDGFGNASRPRCAPLRLS